MAEVIGTPAAELLDKSGRPITELYDQYGRPAVRRYPTPSMKMVSRGLADYDPDFGVGNPNGEKEHRTPFETSTEDYVKRYAIPIKRPEGEAQEPLVEAVMQTPTLFREEGRTRWRWKPERVTGSLREFQDYVDSTPMKWSLESLGIPFDFGQPDNFSGTTGATSLIDRNQFIPFLNGPFYKQLYQYDYLQMHAWAFELTNYSALAAGAVKILTRFVIGRGISFLIKDPECKQIWDEFWERNRMREAARQMARDITWQGELMMQYKEPHEGYVGFQVLDPSSCWEVVTDPEDFTHVYYYHFQYPTPYQIWISGNIPVSKYILRQVPPTQIQHVKINISSQEKRGRSDLLPCLPWLKRFNDYYNGIVVKAMLEANLVYKVKVHGDQNDVNTIATDPQFTVLPPMGGMWLENDAVDLEPITAQMTSSRGSSGIGQQLAAIIATALNLPAEYFNIESGAAARATALVRTDPAVKTVEDRQQTIKELLEDCYDRVIEAAIRSGRIDKSKGRLEPEAGDGDDTENPELPEDQPDSASKPVASAHARPVRAAFAMRGI